jgi:poly(3-hydroxybutyrate) depolymerase
MWRGLAMVFVWLVALAVPALAGGIETRTINVGGMIRTYYFMHPASVKGPGPLIVGFHGGGQMQ